jgi:hypothetical protein
MNLIKRDTGCGKAWACMGAALISIAAQAQQPNNDFSYSRTSGFTYQPNGQLETETVEPSNPNLCVVSKHWYDGFGNRKETTTSNWCSWRCAVHCPQLWHGDLWRTDDYHLRYPGQHTRRCVWHQCLQCGRTH